MKTDKIAEPIIDIILNCEGGNNGLTEEFIYNNPPNVGEVGVVILSSATVESKYMGRVNKQSLRDNNFSIFEGPCIVVARNGTFAGIMRYVDGEFTTTDHAYVLTPKPEWKNKLNLRWFMQQYQGLFYSLITSRSDNATFAKEYAVKQTVFIPDIEIQNNIANQLVKLDGTLKRINQLSSLSSEVTVHTNTKVVDVGENHKLSEVLSFKGGNSGLTEEFIYSNMPKNDKDKLPVLTGSVSGASQLGYVSKEAKIDGNSLKMFHGPSILVSRKGQAGTMTFIEYEDFTTNDDAYVLTARAGWDKMVNLRWFIYQYQSLFYNLVTSKSDNSTFNKEYAERQIIYLPDKEKVQDVVANGIIRLSKFNRHMERLKIEIENLLAKQVALTTQP